ncbi:MAG TPA: hypothetical protein VLA16_03640, partial [Ideonella sp.]|nr:hypothetical protein [Ideonella sp.]
MSETKRAAMQPQDHFELKLPSDPQISPDGRHVAYVRTRADLQSDSWLTELCVVDRVAGARHELGPGSQPRWAPDGTGLAFVRAAAGAGAGFAIERWQTGSAQRSVLATLAQAPSGLAWSPDGAVLAFVMRVTPVPTAPLDRDVPAWETLRTAQWSAPGLYTEALVRRIEGIDADLPEGHHHIFLLDLASGALRQLTEGPFNHGGPLTDVTKMALAGRISWTPDIRHIVMSMQRPEPQAGPLDPKATIAADVYEFDVADGAVRQLTRFGGPV